MATETDKVNTGALATLVAVGAFAMIGICLSLVALVRDQLENEHADKDRYANASYLALKDEQKKKLESGVPIENAMATVVSELAKDPASAAPPAAAGASPAPGGTPAAGSAEPAAPGSATPSGAGAPGKK